MAQAGQAAVPASPTRQARMRASITGLWTKTKSKTTQAVRVARSTATTVRHAASSQPSRTQSALSPRFIHCRNPRGGPDVARKHGRWGVRVAAHEGLVWVFPGH